MLSRLLYNNYTLQESSQKKAFSQIFRSVRWNLESGKCQSSAVASRFPLVAGCQPASENDPHRKACMTHGSSGIMFTDREVMPLAGWVRIGRRSSLEVGH